MIDLYSTDEDGDDNVRQPCLGPPKKLPVVNEKPRPVRYAREAARRKCVAPFYTHGGGSFSAVGTDDWCIRRFEMAQ